MHRSPAERYIFAHGGISTVVRHLSRPSPPMTYEALAHGIARMVGDDVAEELRLTARTPS